LVGIENDQHVYNCKLLFPKTDLDGQLHYPSVYQCSRTEADIQRELLKGGTKLEEDQKEQCGNCRYYHEEKSPAFPQYSGFCRKNPPTINLNETKGITYIMIFPPVRTNDWCGKFKAKKKEN